MLTVEQRLKDLEVQEKSHQKVIAKLQKQIGELELEVQRLNMKSKKHLAYINDLNQYGEIVR